MIAAEEAIQDVNIQVCIVFIFHHCMFHVINELYLSGLSSRLIEVMPAEIYIYIYKDALKGMNTVTYRYCNFVIS